MHYPGKKVYVAARFVARARREVIKCNAPPNVGRRWLTRREILNITKRKELPAHVEVPAVNIGGRVPLYDRRANISFRIFFERHSMIDGSLNAEIFSQQKKVFQFQH